MTREFRGRNYKPPASAGGGNTMGAFRQRTAGLRRKLAATPARAKQKARGK